MWLDRFASHSAQHSPSGTPPPQGRSYSPAPSRRPYLTPGPLPPRPGFPPRSSSISLVSPSSSSSSLPPAARIPNGSGLRFQVSGSPPADVPDPVKVLEDIFGGPSKSNVAEDSDAEAVDKPVEVVTDIDFGGLSLQEFAEGDSEQRPQRPSHVHTYSTESVEEYDKAKDKFEDLHRSVTACDEVLKSVETYLTGFQADLGAVSAEIETLQTRSTQLTTRLENRKVVERLLGPAVEEASISPAVVKKIAEGPIDEGFPKALQELEKRSKALKTKSNEETDVKAVNDLKPLLDDLTNKAVERIRDYIVAQIKALRSPSINAQIIQQQGFLKYKELYAFLAKHQKQLADELCQAYVNTMRWYYLTHFTRYHQALNNLKIHVIDQHDTLGNENITKRSGALLNNPKMPTAPHDAFSLGRRLDLLKGSHQNALTSHVAEDDKSTHYLELIFHSFNLALIDNASFEYTFLTSYFSPAQTYHGISRIFSQVWEPSFALGQHLTKSLTDTTMDALGILLCVRLNQHFAFELQRRKIPAMEGYINGTNMLLWPRFQLVMDGHCKSVQALTSSLPGRPAASSLLTSAAPTDQSTAPVPLTQRFANFLHGVLALSSEAADDEPVSNSLARLRSEYEAYLAKRSKSIAEQRKRERFLFNNLSLVGTILEGTEGRLAEDMRVRFREARDRHGDGG